MDYKSLKSLVQHHDKLYYDLGSPNLTDAEYDGIYDQLVEMERLQGWKDSDSPTARIIATGGKIKHPHKLYSLKKVYDVKGAYSPKQNAFQPRSPLRVYHRQLFPEAVVAEKFNEGIIWATSSLVWKWATLCIIGSLEFDSSARSWKLNWIASVFSF